MAWALNACQLFADNKTHIRTFEAPFQIPNICHSLMSSGDWFQRRRIVR